MRRSVVFTAVVSVLLLTAAPVRAEFRPLEPHVERLVSDGERFAVAARTDRSLAVFDDEGPAPGLAPPACAAPGASARLLSLGGGKALFACPRKPDGSLDVAILDLVTRAVVVPSGLDALDREAEADAFAFAVGRHWLHVYMETHRGGYTRFLNWRTGAVRQDYVGDARRTVVPDLDLPTLERRVCSPLRRTIETVDLFFGSGETQAWAPSEYRDRHLLTGSRLQRCGSRRARILRRADDHSAHLAPGRVTWREGSDLVIEPLRRGAHRTRLALPAGDGSVVQTRRRIFFSEYQGNRAVHVARAPK